MKTKKELITLALREYIEHHVRMGLRELRGGGEVAPDYDHRTLRERAADESSWSIPTPGSIGS